MTRRTCIRYCIDIGLVVSAVLCIATGIIKFPELTSTINRTGLVLPFNLITYVHDWSGVVLAVLIVIHLVFGWPWLAGISRAAIRKR